MKKKSYYLLTIVIAILSHLHFHLQLSRSFKLFRIISFKKPQQNKQNKRKLVLDKVLKMLLHRLKMTTLFILLNH